MTFLCAKNALQRHFAWLEMPIYIFSATVLLQLWWGGRSCRRALFGGFHLVTDSGLFVGIWWISKILMINAAKQNRYRLHYIFGWNTDKLLVMYINWLVVIINLVKYLVLLNYLEVSVLFSIILCINHLLMPHFNVTDSVSTQVIFFWVLFENCV